MAEYTILSETQISVYQTPTTRVKQQVITYQAPGLAPRTVWIDSLTLPDIKYQIDNPGKSVPANVQAEGDKVRRAAFDADMAKISKTTAPRRI
jgi:hypothetical protein